MFAKIITVACALVSIAQASPKSARIQFTHTPGPATVGTNNTIEWSEGNGDRVTLILRQGDPNNLQTVGIIASNVQGSSYNWVPSSSLPTADDYALEITQDDDTNYSGLFSLVGGSNASATTVLVAAGSTTVAITTIAPNSTTITATAVLTGTASGTGISVPRNTTFSSQTLGSTSTGGGINIGTATATSTASAAAGGSTTTAAAPSSSTGAASPLKVQSAVGLGALFAAIFML